MMDQIEAVKGMQLPWENALSQEVHNQLGVFRKHVLKLLARDPAERPSMEEFCASCDCMLDGTTDVRHSENAHRKLGQRRSFVPNFLRRRAE